MSDTITVTGIVATDPRHIVTSEGLAITSFRLASTQRRYDKSEQKWVDAETNWYTVTGFRQLAMNAAGSIHKGERVVATGRLKVRSWDTGEKTGTTVEVEADALGHDLAWGASTFSRSMSSSTAERTGLEAGQSSAETPELESGSAEGGSSPAGFAPGDREIEPAF